MGHKRATKTHRGVAGVHRTSRPGDKASRRTVPTSEARDRSELRLFEAACAAVVMGLEPEVDFKGTERQVESLARALDASRALYEALRDDAPMQEVNRLIRLKRSAARRFELVHRRPWHL